MDAPSNQAFTLEELASRWIMTSATVASRIATGAIPLTASDRRFARADVLAFEQTPYGKALVLRAIRLDGDDVTRSHQQAAGYEPRPGVAADVVTVTPAGDAVAEVAR